MINIFVFLFFLNFLSLLKCRIAILVHRFCFITPGQLSNLCMFLSILFQSFARAHIRKQTAERGTKLRGVLARLTCSGLWLCFSAPQKLGVGVQTWNPSTWKVEVENEPFKAIPSYSTSWRLAWDGFLSQNTKQITNLKPEWSSAKHRELFLQFLWIS